MKHQYFGDINDYRKYGLLRVLQSNGDRKLLVVWMLTADDDGRDGGRRSYLQAPAEWQEHDPELFATLASLLRSTGRPRVSYIEQSGLLSNSSFFSEPVPDSREGRVAWRQGLLEAADDADLVFLDPDNGIEVPSRPIGRKGSSKYVAWYEIEALWAAGCSILIYQHFRREDRDLLSNKLVADLQRLTRATLVEAFRTAHALFLLAAQERHEPGFRGAMPLLHLRWANQIEQVGQAKKPLWLHAGY